MINATAIRALSFRSLSAVSSTIALPKPPADPAPATSSSKLTFGASKLAQRAIEEDPIQLRTGSKFASRFMPEEEEMPPAPKGALGKLGAKFMPEEEEMPPPPKAAFDKLGAKFMPEEEEMPPPPKAAFGKLGSKFMPEEDEMGGVNPKALGAFSRSAIVPEDPIPPPPPTDRPASQLNSPLQISNLFRQIAIR